MRLYFGAIILILVTAGCSFMSEVPPPPEAPRKVQNLPDLQTMDTPEVQYFVNYYRSRGRRFVVEANARKNEQAATVLPLLARHGVPDTLMSVAMVESGFRPEARSPDGATGIWQFMPATAQQYGLQVGICTDERQDIALSTVAAAKYLVDLYNRFNDWYLALSAYNSGPTAIRKAMAATNSKDYQSLLRSGALNKESADFVSKVLAITAILREPQRYGFRFEAPRIRAENAQPNQEG